MTYVNLHIGIIVWHLCITDFYPILFSLHSLKLDTRLGSAPVRLLSLLLAIEIHLIMSTSSHIEQHLIGLLRTEDSLVLGREAHQLHIWCKGMLSVCCHLDRILFIGDSHRLAFALTIVPESTSETYLAIHGALVIVGVERLVVHQVTSLEGDKLVLLQTTLDAIKDRNSLSWRTIVVTPHHRLVIHVRTDEGDFLLLLAERQYLILVLEKRHGLESHIERELTMSLATEH